MYATVKVAKLAAVMDVSESDLRASLTAFDKANTVKQWNGGASALDGDDVYCGDIRVTMEGDVIKVEEMKNRKSAKTFFEQTNKKLSMQLEELMAAKPLVVKPSAIVS
jgi:DeoR/GlpR family transcriptional regulator of sugar metabolism